MLLGEWYVVCDFTKTSIEGPTLVLGQVDFAEELQQADAVP